MAYARRHWFSSIVCVLIVIFGMAAALTPTLFSHLAATPALAQTQSQAEDEPDPVDPYLYTRVQSLRKELRLTNHDLASLGCTQETASLILEDLKSWCAANQSQLDGNQKAINNTNAAIREQIQLINAGPSANPGSKATSTTSAVRSLSDLEDSLGKRYKQRQAMMDSLAEQLTSRLNSTQQTMWRAAKDNAGLPDRFRYAPTVTISQRQAIATGLSNRTEQVTVASVVEDELTWSQKQIVDTARTNRAVYSSAVRAAEADTLPTPAILKDDSVNVDIQ